MAGSSTSDRDGFLKTMDVSCWSFMRMAHLAEPLMKNGGTLFTMTYYGSQMVVQNYNVMGVAKAALEAAVRYVAAELGPEGNSRPRHFARTLGHARGVGNSRIRRTDGQGAIEGAERAASSASMMSVTPRHSWRSMAPS